MNRFFLFIAFLFHLSIFAQETFQYHQVSSEEFKDLISDNVILLDVRTPSEFKNGHIINAGNSNFYSPGFTKQLLLLPKDKKILLYCNTGYRSEIAAKRLAKKGYLNVYNLEHGIMEWELKDFEVVVEPDAKAETLNKFSSSEYQNLIKDNKYVFIDFYATWCGPCRQMMPMIDSLKTEFHDSINIVKVNVGASKKLSRQLKLKTVPLFRLYKDGVLIFEHSGVISRKEILEQFKTLSDEI